MGARMELRDALVIAKKGEDPIKYRISDKTGKMTASFCVGVKKYDPSYNSGYRYNNFFITVPSDMVEQVKKLQLRRNSMVHLYCLFDYSKDVLVAREPQGDESSPNYGQSRLVNGVILTLRDIEYAGTTGASKNTSDEPKDSREQEHEKTVSKSEASEVPASSKSEKDHGGTGDITKPTASANMEVDKGSLEKELGIGIIDLDKEDIFATGSLKRKKRKFF